MVSMATANRIPAPRCSGTFTGANGDQPGNQRKCAAGDMNSEQERRHVAISRLPPAEAIASWSRRVFNGFIDRMVEP
jgi:hypothetical protein